MRAVGASSALPPRPTPLPVVTLVSGQLWIPAARLLRPDGSWSAHVPGLTAGLAHVRARRPPPQGDAADAAAASMASVSSALGLGTRGDAAAAAVNGVPAALYDGWVLVDACLDSGGMLRLGVSEGIPQCFDVRADFSGVRVSACGSFSDHLLLGFDLVSAPSVLRSASASRSASVSPVTPPLPGAAGRFPTPRSPPVCAAEPGSPAAGPSAAETAAPVAAVEEPTEEVLQLRATSYGNLFDWVDTMHILRREHHHQHFLLVKEPLLEIRRNNPLVHERVGRSAAAVSAA